MIPIFIANSFFIFALGLVVPSVPFMVLEMGAEPEFAAIIFSAFSGAAFLAQPIWGMLADKYGSKNILIVSAFLSSLSYLGLFLSQSIEGLFLARIFAGLVAGWLAASLTYMANISSIENRTKAMGVLGASFGIGFTLGPATSGILLSAYDDYQITALFSFLIVLIISIMCFFFLPNPNVGDTGRDTAQQKSFSILAIFGDEFKTIFASLNLKILFFCYFCVSLIFTSLEGSFALWVKFILKRDAEFLSWILTASGLVFIIIQGGLLGRLNKIFSEKTLILTGIFLLIAGFISLPFATHKIMAFLPIILIATGLSLHNPCVQSLVSKNTDKKHQGLTLGFLQSSTSLSRIFGPILAGYMFIYLGVYWFYFACAFALWLIFMIFLRFVNHQKHHQN